jgi:hypothetical protein
MSVITKSGKRRKCSEPGVTVGRFANDMTDVFQDGTDDRSRDWIIIYDEYTGHLLATASG